MHVISELYWKVIPERDNTYSNDIYDAIALVRGGGSGIEALDDLAVLECVANMQKPLICAVGHVDENLFIKNLADKVAPTPNGLGTYFSNMVETVIQKRNNSRAALVEEVKKQYISQIQTAEKQNKALQEQVEKMVEEFRNGKHKVLLASYSLVAEGFDVPMLENLIMASPVKDERLVIQAIGRCQRPYENKKIANIYDLVDNVSMLERFFTKRKSFYKKEGWKVI